jgi:hypothetical protein
MAANNKETCAIVAAHLVAIADGNAPPEVRRHLESCAGCARLARGFVRAWRDIAPPAEENVSPAFFPRLMERIAADHDLAARREHGAPAALRFLKPVAVAALFAAAIFAGYEVGRTPKREVAAEEAVSPVVLAVLESIPRGSVADFYVTHPISEKEEKQ